MPRRQCSPSRAERSAAAARPCYRQSCALIPEYAHPQPLSHFAVHHDRPISVSSLDRRRGREKLSRKERRSSYKEGGCMTSDIALSARPRASGRLVDWHILQAFPVARRLSCQFCSWRGPIGGSSADLPRKCSWQSPRDDPAASNQPRATQSGRIRHVLRQGGNSPGRSQRIIHLQHLGHS